MENKITESEEKIMRKFKKLFVGALLVTSMVIGTTGIAMAQANSSKYNSPKNTAGTWWSGYDEDEFVSMTSVNNKIYGGDGGLTFYTSSVGLPAGFERSLNRYVTIELKEEDSGAGNDNEIMCRYKTKFSTNNYTGAYLMVPPTKPEYVNGELVETNKVAEMYIRFRIDKLTNDKTKNVPEGVFIYQYWLD